MLDPGDFRALVIRREWKAGIAIVALGASLNLPGPT